VGHNVSDLTAVVNGGWRLATAAAVGYNLSNVLFVLIFQFEFDLLLLSMLKYW
jgi:hypothetical protein